MSPPVVYKTAWLMLQKLRCTIIDPDRSLLEDLVDVTRATFPAAPKTIRSPAVKAECELKTYETAVASESDGLEILGRGNAAKGVVRSVFVEALAKAVTKVCNLSR